MKFAKVVSKLLRFFSLIFISILFINMGGGGKQVVLEPEFAELKEGEGLYLGYIYDDKDKIEIKEISFTGHTSIGGVRKESDDSTNVLDFALMKELEIVDSNYQSEKYSGQEFTRVRVNYWKDGSIPEKDRLFLVPRNVVICGVQTKTGIKKAWFLSKIKKVVLEKDLKKIHKAEKAVPA